jgi:hypothetical protein
MPANSISEYNAAWGICGFTSALTKLYETDTRLQGKIDTTNEATVKFGLLIEVLTFLRYVKAFRADLIGELQDLNKKLRPVSVDAREYAMDNGVAAFIVLAEAFVRAQIPLGTDDKVKNKFQCALTPVALHLYVQKICGFPAARLTQGADPGGQGILGLLNDKGELVHWVFRDAANTVYNWGAVIAPDKWKTSPYGLGHSALKSVGYHVSFG